MHARTVSMSRYVRFGSLPDIGERLPECLLYPIPDIGRPIYEYTPLVLLSHRLRRYGGQRCHLAHGIVDVE